MTETDFIKFVNKKKWTFAKTYAEKSPHEYMVCETHDENRKEFEQAVIFIRKNGKIENYYGHPFTVYKIEGHKYWTMGESIEKTTLINRSIKGQQDRTYGD